MEETSKKPLTDQLNLRQVEDSARRNYFSLFPEEQLHSILDAFVINKPMAGNVGGDGFWVFQGIDCLFLAVFDCMGHGHLASMMTRIYTNGLKKVFQDDLITMPGEALNRLHADMKAKFEGKENLQVGTGADVGVVKIGLQQRELIFAGAKMDLHMVKNSTLEYIKADRLQIGEMWDVDRTYQDHVIELGEIGSLNFYLSSDGLRDLFGGPENRKLGKPKVQALLELNAEYSMRRQKDIFTTYIEQWSGSNMQLDDLLFVGFKL